MHNFQRSSGSNPVLFFAGLALGAILAPVVKRKMDNSEAWQNMKERTWDKFDRTREAGQEIYNEIVDEVTDKYARAKGISKNELTDLVDDLKMHWGRIKQAWSE